MLAKNTCLRELHCEMNEIHLQGFTALVNAMETNHTLIYLPRMDRDRSDQLRALKERLCQPSTVVPEAHHGHHLHLHHSSRSEKKSSFRKSAKNKKVSFTEEEALLATDVEQNLLLIDEKWESEAMRLQAFLARNINMRSNERRRPGVGSAGSISGMGLLWGVDAR